MSDFQEQLKENEKISKLKGELLHLILNGISPTELDWIQKNLDKIPDNHLEKMMILVGKIVEKIKR